MKTIDTTTKGIDNNNAQTKSKTVLIEEQDRLFKISCVSNTYDFQSNGAVYIMGTDNKWERIKSFNMAEDYNVQHSYQYFKESNFDNAIKDLKKLIKKTAKFMTVTA